MTTNNFSQARRLVAQRARGTRSKKVPKQYTVLQLRKDIAYVTHKKSYVREAKTKENRFMTLLNGINELWQDAELVEILRNENLSARPELVGNFHYEN